MTLIEAIMAFGVALTYTKFVFNFGCTIGELRSKTQNDRQPGKL